MAINSSMKILEMLRLVFSNSVRLVLQNWFRFGYRFGAADFVMRRCRGLSTVLVIMHRLN